MMREDGSGGAAPSSERTVALKTRHVAIDTQPDAELGPAVGSRILGLFSGQERKLIGDVPRELTLRARLGYVELDLTEATFQAGVTSIDVDAILGYVQVRFPPDVRVESDGHAVFGFFAFSSNRPSPDGDDPDARPLVRVTGGALCGFAEGVVHHTRTLSVGER